MAVTAMTIPATLTRGLTAATALTTGTTITR